MEYKRQVNMPNTPLPDDATPEQKASWQPRIIIDVPLTDAEIVEHKQKIAEHEAKQGLIQLRYQRSRAYPSIVDQLDILYHQGFDAWKEQIKAVKDKYPK